MNEKMYYVGIDIGSTAAKVVVLDDSDMIETFSLPTGWNGKETAQRIEQMLLEKGYAKSMKCVAIGYGRVCVDYADKIVTEITCHGKICRCIRSCINSRKTKNSETIDWTRRNRNCKL